MHHLNNHDHDYVLILSGDQLYQMNFEELARYHIKQKSRPGPSPTIPVVDRDAPGFGIMKVNEKGFIDNFVEKPAFETLGEWQSAVPESYAKDGKLYLASMGIYLFKRAFLKKLFDDNPEATDFGKEIIPHAIEKGFKVASYSFDGYWTDIGTIRSFFEANIALTDDIPKFDLFNSEKQIYTRPRLLGPSKIFGTWFNQSVISEGCIIHAKKMERCVVGIRSRIGENTEISNAIVMGNDRYETLEEIEKNDNRPNLGIGKNCHIRNAIIDKDVRMGDNVNIHGSVALQDIEKETHCIKDGIIVIKKGAIIPDGMKIGLGA